LQYWDSSLFISLLTNADPERVKVLQDLLEQEKRGAIEIAISTLVIAEARPYGAAHGVGQQEFDSVLEMFESERLNVWAVTPRIAFEAARIGFSIRSSYRRTAYTSQRRSRRRLTSYSRTTEPAGDGDRET
jgi:hypothetical protein